MQNTWFNKKEFDFHLKSVKLEIKLPIISKKRFKVIWWKEQKNLVEFYFGLDIFSESTYCKTFYIKKLRHSYYASI